MKATKARKEGPKPWHGLVPPHVAAALTAVEARVAPYGRGFYVDVPPGWPEAQINARWPGLTTSMNACFFPHYDMHKVKVSKKSRPHYDTTASSRREVLAKKAYARRKGVSVAVAGRRFGTEVHHALDVLVGVRRRGDKPRDIPIDAQRKAQEILKRIAAMRLVVLCSEMGIRSLVAGCATAVDLVAWSPATRRLFLIEVKCGTYGSKFEAGTGAASGPLPVFDDSPLSQAMLQTVLPAQWLTSEGGLSPSDVGVMVLRVRTRPPDTIDVIRYSVGRPEGLTVMWARRRQLADYFAAWMKKKGRRNMGIPGAPKRPAKKRRRRVEDVEDADVVVISD